MANMLFTTFGILSPMAYNIFLLVVVVGFFGFYVPWNERRKKGGGQRPAEGTGRGRKSSAPMGRAKAFVWIILCFPVAVAGMTMLIASLVMGEPLMIALGGGLTIFSLLRMERAGKDFRAGRTSRQPKPKFRSEAPDHEHIVPFGQGGIARLEQLEVLKSAGLISDQEYQQKRREILNGL